MIKALVLCELVNKYLNKNWQNVTENDVKTFKKFEVTKHIKNEIEILTDSGTDPAHGTCPTIHGKLFAILGGTSPDI